MRLPQPIFRRRSKAFTLVELLRARQQALSIQCQSNVRQLLIASQMYANDNDGVMPGYNAYAGPQTPGDWWVQLAKYIARPDFNATDPKHNYVAVYNCPACDQNLIQASQLYPFFWNQYPATYAISPLASDTSPPTWPGGGHNAPPYAYWYTKYNQWFAELDLSRRQIADADQRGVS